MMMRVLGRNLIPLDLNLVGGRGVRIGQRADTKTYHSSKLSTLSDTSNNLLCLSDQLKFWSSKFIVRDGDQLIDVSSAACASSSTLPIGATHTKIPYSGTVYQFDPMLFHNTEESILCSKLDLDDVEQKLFSMLKSHNTVDGCKFVQRRADKGETCNRKRSWTYIFSHGKVMRYIDDSHFGPDSVGMLNETHQHSKKHKSKGSIRGNCLCAMFIN
jgi:hypothetical protein